MPEQSDPQPLTVVALTVDSYKRMHAAELHPSPTGLIPVRGRNGQGKSSLIGSMLDGLGVERSALPITEGAHGSSVVMDLGDLVVKKVWTRDDAGKAKAALTITTRDGAKVQGPAGVLKELRGHFADPVAFLELPAADQVKTALAVLGLDEQLRELEQVEASHFERRRDVGRDHDRAKKAVEELQREIDGLPPVPTSGSVEELTNALQSARDHNDRLQRFASQKADAERRGQELAERIERMKVELAKAEEQKAATKVAWKEANAGLKGEEPIDTEPIVEQLRDHEAAAKHAARRELFEETKRQAERFKLEHEAEEKALEEARDAITALLTKTPFPVDGMAYDPKAKAITVNGIPYEQASQAERLKIAAGIAMAGNPRIRVVFAREGSLLDEESQAQLAELAAAAGFQLWLEVVDSKREGSGVWIEDGQAFEESAS